VTDLVTLANCDNSGEAYIIQGRLKAEGIFAVVDGDFPGVAYGEAFIGTAKVRVREEDFKRAMAVLERARRVPRKSN
jgi:hypothetical protein